MKEVKLVVLFATISFLQLYAAQKQLPIINASSKIVDIKAGKYVKKSYWTILPEVKPDVYTTSVKKIVFCTDVDSISFKLDSKHDIVDFIILLNGKDSAYTRIKYQIPYLEKLKRAEKYNYNDSRLIPKFSYQSKENPNLIKIRQELKLDSIVGKGNEISKILNLMHWVHSIVRHDGNSNNPDLKNAIDLINVCKAEKRGVNCRMMATILNECYLSLGIKSRFVTCMPKETKFDDCHVINVVYSYDLNKWIWIDPTFDAYVMNEKGELLGIDEVRERLIKGKTLILNPDANWNKQESQTKDYYLENYMAKNLFRLECPISSEYDIETYKESKTVTYMELLPLDGLVQTTKSTKYHITNNPNLFWAKPE